MLVKKKLNSQVLGKASVLDNSDHEPVETRALVSVLLIAAACLLMKRRNLNIGMPTPVHPAPVPVRIVVEKHGFGSEAISTEPSGSFIISHEASALFPLNALTMGCKKLKY